MEHIDGTIRPPERVYPSAWPLRKGMLLFEFGYLDRGVYFIPPPHFYDRSPPGLQGCPRTGDQFQEQRQGIIKQLLGEDYEASEGKKGNYSKDAVG